MFQSAHVGAAGPNNNGGISADGGWVSDTNRQGLRQPVKRGYCIIWNDKGVFQDRSIEAAVFTIRAKDTSTLTFNNGVFEGGSGQKTASAVVEINDKTNSYKYRVTGADGAVLMEATDWIKVARDASLYVSQSADAVAQDQTPVETPQS